MYSLLCAEAVRPKTDRVRPTLPIQNITQTRDRKYSLPFNPVFTIGSAIPIEDASHLLGGTAPTCADVALTTTARANLSSLPERLGVLTIGVERRDLVDLADIIRPLELHPLRLTKDTVCLDFRRIGIHDRRITVAHACHRRRHVFKVRLARVVVLEDISERIRFILRIVVQRFLPEILQAQ